MNYKETLHNLIIPKQIIIFLLLFAGILILGFVSSLVPRALVAIIALGLVFIYLYALSPKYLLLLLLLFRNSIDVFARGYRLFGQSSVSINLLGLLNIAIVGIALFYFIFQIRKLPRYPFVLPLTLFLCFAAISIINSSDRMLSLRGWMSVASYVAIYFLVVRLFRSEKSLDYLRIVLVFSTLIPICFGFYQIVTETGNTIISPGLNRVFGTLNHPSSLGMYLVIIWPLIFYSYNFSKKWIQKMGFGIILVCTTLVVFLTYTRVAWFALAITIFSLLLIFRRYDLLIIFAVIGFFAGSVFLAPLLSRFGEAFSFENGRIIFSEFGSVAWRFGQWKDAINLFFSHPLVGIGIWTFPIYNIYGTTPHNDYLRVAAEMGIIGLVSYIFILLNLMIWYIRKFILIRSFADRRSICLIGLITTVIFAYIIFGLTDNPLGLPEVSWYFWCLIGFGVNKIRLDKRNLFFTRNNLKANFT